MLRVIGAGFPRTGTLSLEPALELLLGARCYHGVELGRRLEHVDVCALGLQLPTVEFPKPNYRSDWTQLLAGFGVVFD